MPDTDRRGLQWLSGEYRSRDAYGGAIAETITRRGDEDAWINWQATRGHPSCSSTLSCGSHADEDGYGSLYRGGVAAAVAGR